MRGDHGSPRSVPSHRTRARGAENLLAEVVFAKYGLHLPLHRQSERFAREGVPIEVSTLADWVGAVSVSLQPLVEAIKVHVLAGSRITHTLADIIRFRLLMIAAGYEDGNDAAALRRDPLFKMALDLAPSDRELCSQPTISRLENLPDVRSLLRMGRAMVDLYCASFRQVPRRIVLDIDDTFDAVHGGQQLRLFNAHYDEYGFQPIVVFDGEGRFVTAVLRPAKRPKGTEIRALLRRLLRAIRANWPATAILLRADSHYCGPEVIDWCRANGVDFIFGVAPTSTLRRHVERLEASTLARYVAAPHAGKVRRYTEFYDGAASWSRVERIIARVEAGADGTDTRFIVTSLPTRNARVLYEERLLPARRGGEPHQGVEDAPCRRSDLLHQGHREPVPAVSACRRLLAAVEPALADAQTLAVARGAVRHLAPSPDQDRRARGRAEDPDPASPADGLPRPSHPAGRSRADPAVWSHDRRGAHAPDPSPSRSTRKPHCSDRRPRTGAGQAMPATLTRRHTKPLEQAGSRYGELMRLLL